MSSKAIDYDEEGRQLLARLNLTVKNTGTSMWNPLDPIYKHPTGGGTIYVGNQNAAENINLLRAYSITHIVNCTYGFSKIPDYHTGKLKYYEFAISHWSSFVDNTDSSVLAFVNPLFEFIDSAISTGNNVLVHCLAGAHRAGSTGVACLIRYADMDVDVAIKTAKKLRPVIDPIGQLPDFLKRLKRALDSKKSITS
mmetsp:Transcript_19324/g.17551  ORF Transcript_19324/g.17551 Transcript_19324/m.17551 type:complete len:196 (+) Transcript_19324:39-626(+)